MLNWLVLKVVLRWSCHARVLCWCFTLLKKVHVATTEIHGVNRDSNGSKMGFKVGKRLKALCSLRWNPGEGPVCVEWHGVFPFTHSLLLIIPVYHGCITFCTRCLRNGISRLATHVYGDVMVLLRFNTSHPG